MAATVRVSYWSGAGPTSANAETGIKFNREESQSGSTTPIPKPNSTGTNYAWPKVLSLEVTVTDTTSLSNRKLNLAGAPTTGLTLWYIDDTTTYNRSTTVAAADNATTDDAAPASYSAITTGAITYDASSVSAGSTGRNGHYLRAALGVSSLYTGGAGSNISLPNIVFTYDEA